MELTILNTFNKFLLKNGVVDQEGVNYLTNLVKNEKNKEENFEFRLITKLSDYFIDLKNEKRITTLAHSLYEKYISLDDEKIEKTIKRLLTCYENKHRRTLLNYFLKYKLKIHKIKVSSRNNFSTNENISLNNSIYIKKKFQEVPISKTSDNLQIKCAKNKIDNKQDAKYSSNNTEENLKNDSELKSIIQMKISNPENFAIIKGKKEIHNRLYEDGQRRRNLQNDLHDNERSKEIRECTFSPKINKYNTNFSQNNSKDPAYIHLYEARKDREQKLRQMSIEKEKEMNVLYSFTPNINKTNSKICSTEFFARLKVYDNTKSERFKKIKEEANRIPSITHRKVRSKSVLKNLENSGLNASFDLIEYQKKKNEKLKKIENSILLEQGITFKPKLNESVNMNINSSLLERNEEFVRNRSQKIKQYKTKTDNEYTFSPKVNNMSCKPSTDELSVGERLFNYQSLYKTNIETIKDSLKETHSFKPDINPNTYDILKQREIVLNEIRNKYDLNPKTKAFKIHNNASDDKVAEAKEEISVESQFEGYISERNRKIPGLNNNKFKSKDENISNEKLKEKKYKSDFLAKKLSPVKNISDSHLLELANNFINTDESLELFQARMREKYSKFTADRRTQFGSFGVVNKEKVKNSQDFNEIPPVSNNSEDNAVNEGSILNNSRKKSASKNKSKDKKLFKNFEVSMKYYNMLDA